VVLPNCNLVAWGINKVFFYLCQLEVIGEEQGKQEEGYLFDVPEDNYIQ
jgi:hypothetical protein